MRPFLFSIAILAGSAVSIFFVFAAIQIALQIALLFPAQSFMRLQGVGLLNGLAAHVIATTATVVSSIVAGRWLWVNKNIHPVLFKIAVGIASGVVIAFVLYLVYLRWGVY